MTNTNIAAAKKTPISGLLSALPADSIRGYST
jgi:hypothetical protein